MKSLLKKIRKDKGANKPLVKPRYISPHLPLDKLDSVLRQALERHSGNLIDILRAIVQDGNSHNSDLLEFNIDVPFDPGHHVVYIHLYTTGDTKGTTNSDPTLMELGDIPCFEPSDEERFESSGYTHCLTHLMIEWFKECWWKAGGWSFPVPATIKHSEPGYMGPDILTEKTL